jgi:hypothetical protein
VHSTALRPQRVASIGCASIYDVLPVNVPMNGYLVGRDRRRRSNALSRATVATGFCS